MLESLCHGDNAFVTLTYNDENYPHDHSVDPRELQLYLKRLRKRFPRPLRYFAVGEYGDHTMRPHYHLALFGYPTCIYGQTTISKSGNPTCCSNCGQLYDAWGKGSIQNARLEPESCQYICGYVVKKMTRDTDIRLEGRLPEFARMSLKPGIGHDMMHDLAHKLMDLNLDEKLLDVPTTLAHGTSEYPLGRYLRKKLRKMIGRDEKTPEKSLEAYKEKLRPMRKAAFLASASFASEILEASKGRRIQIEAKQRRFSKKARL
jgi:hypothetical protein